MGKFTVAMDFCEIPMSGWGWSRGAAESHGGGQSQAAWGRQTDGGGRRATAYASQTLCELDLHSWRRRAVGAECVNISSDAAGYRLKFDAGEAMLASVSLGQTKRSRVLHNRWRSAACPLR